MNASSTLKMKIDRMHCFDGEGTVKAFCDLLMMDTFVVRGFKVVLGKEGLFVSMPREQRRDGNWYDTFLPIPPGAKKEIQDFIMEEYEQQKNSPRVPADDIKY